MLTRRQSTKVWLRSQEHHHKTHPMNTKIYGIEKNEKDPQAKHRAFYEKQLVEVRAYFAGARTGCSRSAGKRETGSGRAVLVLRVPGP